MEMDYVVVFAGMLIPAILGWVGHHISNQPKIKENKNNQISSIITHLENQWDRCENRVVTIEKRLNKACGENRALRKENRELKRELEDSQKGGEELGESEEQ